MLEEVEKFFKDVDNIRLVDFYTNFLSENKPIHEETRELVKKFLDDHGLNNAHTNMIYDLKNKPMFFRCSSSERTVLNKIHFIISDIITQRFTNMVYDGKIIENENKLSFIFLKEELMNVYACLNSNGNYMFSFEEDMKMSKKIRETRWK